MDKSTTKRGLFMVRFKDKYDRDCYLHDSSHAEAQCIWFGLDNDGSDPMCLTQEAVKELLPFLQSFVEIGQLGKISTVLIQTS